MTWLHDPVTLLWLAFSVVVALIGATLAHDIYRDAARHRDAEDVVRDLDGTSCWACHRTVQPLTDGYCDDTDCPCDDCDAIRAQRMNRRHLIGAGLSVGFVGTILAANYLTDRYEFVPVGFGLAATAGTYAAGFTLALRDGVQDTLGRRWVAVLILVGAALSFALSAPAIAVASGVAFLVAELADFAVYTPLRARAKVGDRRWAVAVLASNVVGAVIDTALFVGIAFGAAAVMPAMGGQLVGKTWASLVYVLIGVIVVALLRQSLRTRGGGRDA